MTSFTVKFSETFYDDLRSIISHILENGGSEESARRFYDGALAYIERRSFGADSFEPFYPYADSPEYYRIYYGSYIIFYVLEDGAMDIRRMLWAGRDLIHIL